MKNRREFIGVSLAASAGVMLTGAGYGATSTKNTGPILAIAAHPGFRSICMFVDYSTSQVRDLVGYWQFHGSPVVEFVRGYISDCFSLFYSHEVLVAGPAGTLAYMALLVTIAYRQRNPFLVV